MNTPKFVSVLNDKNVFFAIFGIIFCLARSEKINPKGCGVSKPIARISGGQEASKEEIPWIVSLTVTFPLNATANTEHGCGGSIISPSFILTAAHCLYNDHNRQPPSKVSVNYNSPVKRSEEERLVVDYIIHPKYNDMDRKTSPYDIAILKLDRRLVFDDFVKPICLPRRKFDIAGKTFLIAGWGLTETGEYSTVLLRATLKGISDKKCEPMLYSEGLPFLKEKMICAHRDAGQFCTGDSGGPMTFRKKDGISLLLGIIQGAGPCNIPYSLNLGVRVSSHIPWIKKQMKRLKKAQLKNYNSRTTG